MHLSSGLSSEILVVLEPILQVERRRATRHPGMPGGGGKLPCGWERAGGRYVARLELPSQRVLGSSRFDDLGASRR
jgi:hypothetical protein